MSPCRDRYDTSRVNDTVSCIIALVCELNSWCNIIMILMSHEIIFIVTVSIISCNITQYAYTNMYYTLYKVAVNKKGQQIRSLSTNRRVVFFAIVHHQPRYLTVPRSSLYSRWTNLIHSEKFSQKLRWILLSTMLQSHAITIVLIFEWVERIVPFQPDYHSVKDRGT